MEAFGDGVGLTESPHGSDGFCPGGEGFGQCVELFETDVFKILDVLQEVFGVLPTGTFGLAFVVKQVANGAHFLIERPQRREAFEERLQALFLSSGELFRAGAQELEKGAVVADLSQFPGQLGEVVHDDAHGMEAIADKDLVGEPLFYQIPISIGEVDADNAHAVTAFEGTEKLDHFPGAAALNDIKNPLPIRLAEAIPRPDPRQARHKVTVAATATVTPCLHHHLALHAKTGQVPHTPLIEPLAVNMGAPTTRTLRNKLRRYPYSAMTALAFTAYNFVFWQFYLYHIRGHVGLYRPHVPTF